MISLKQFVGALIESVVGGRVISDSASAKIAEHYLGHDLLKGFPIPRMHIQNIDVELQFAIASHLGTDSLLHNQALRHNVSYKIQYFLMTLPNNESLEKTFVKKPEFAEKWNSQLQEFTKEVDQLLLEHQDSEQNALIQMLSLAVENFFYAIALDFPQYKVLSVIGDALQKMNNLSKSKSLHDCVRDNIENILASVDTRFLQTATPELADDLPDLKVLVKASELEGVDSAKIQKVKLVLNSSDRKWIKMEGDKEPTYILDKH